MTNTQMQIITFRLESHYVEALKRRGERDERSLSKTIRRILIDDLTRPSSPAGRNTKKPRSMGMGNRLALNPDPHSQQGLCYETIEPSLISS